MRGPRDMQSVGAVAPMVFIASVFRGVIERVAENCTTCVHAFMIESPCCPWVLTQEHNIRPCDIWNVDECGKVWSRVASLSTYTTSKVDKATANIGSDTTHMSAVGLVSASGKRVPLVVVWQGVYARRCGFGPLSYR